MCHALQSQNHDLNETSLKGLDIVVEEARLAGLKLILRCVATKQLPANVHQHLVSPAKRCFLNASP